MVMPANYFQESRGSGRNLVCVSMSVSVCVERERFTIGESKQSALILFFLSFFLLI